MIVVYGLKNCDTCRKALAWLREHGIEHRFHDVRADGLDRATVAAWLIELGQHVVVNRRGSTWDGLLVAEQSIIDDPGMTRLLLARPALLKRPIFDLGDRRVVGFGERERRILLERA